MYTTFYIEKAGLKAPERLKQSIYFNLAMYQYFFIIKDEKFKIELDMIQALLYKL